RREVAHEIIEERCSDPDDQRQLDDMQAVHRSLNQAVSALRKKTRTSAGGPRPSAESFILPGDPSQFRGGHYLPSTRWEFPGNTMFPAARRARVMIVSVGL